MCGITRGGIAVHEFAEVGLAGEAVLDGEAIAVAAKS
jgi:hypothetical protein